MDRKRKIGVKLVKEETVSLHNDYRIAYLLLSYVLMILSILVSRNIWGSTLKVVFLTTTIYVIYFILMALLHKPLNLLL